MRILDETKAKVEKSLEKEYQQAKVTIIGEEAPRSVHPP